MMRAVNSIKSLVRCSRHIHDIHKGQRGVFQLTFCRISSTYPRNTVDNNYYYKTNDNRAVVHSVRHAHSDLKWPDFSKDRRGTGKDPEMPALEGSYTRKVMSYLPVAAALTAGIYATKTVTQQFITSMSPAKDVLAMAQAEVKISGLEVGQMMTIKWRGKPLFIKRRAQADIEVERKTPLNILRDPEKDEDRVIKDEWLIVIGVCTHLGCVPISNAGDYNAFYCPCHGSHYDHSGRIRKGPAPTNLEVPPYVFLNDETILVG